ncbi:MAG: glutamate--tRNA ligase [Ectothiorhodospiraceae bacterium]|nr:glutamate--tRNA ligase [Ectothiorhodospiraceae bacterium]
MNNNVRVRFAPSPTGYLHVGGLRTALYNYLFARKNGGVFVLRIEDTDRTRYVEGAVENLVGSLQWAGLEFDEGPGAPGDFGPYTQSERTELYREYANQLIEEGHAYRSFITPEQLDEMRKENLAEEAITERIRKDRNLSADLVQKLLSENRPHTIRLKAPLTGEIAFKDIVRGDIRVPAEAIDDQVLLKSDGYPTYHLANVVDDHHMQISHVIRGEEWLPSTGKHVLLYQALGWNIPEFAHLPLLLNPDKTKLSKRQGDVSVEDYRSKGYLPEALVNFVALLGWSPADDNERLSMDELIDAFSLERVGKAGAVFDQQKLEWFNGQYVREAPIEQRIAMCSPHLEAAGYTLPEPETLATIVEASTKYLTFPADITEHAAVFFTADATPESEEAKQVLETEDAITVVSALRRNLEGLEDWTADNFKAEVKSVQKETGIKGKNLFMPIRVALTGSMHGPDIPLIAEVFGKEKTLARLQG